LATSVAKAYSGNERFQTEAEDGMAKRGAHEEPLVVVGGGIGGLAVALALGRDGRRVVVIERDPVPDTDDPETAFVAARRGAPQVRHTHGLLARLTVVLEERFPDVLETLRAAGAQELWPTSGDGGRLADAGFPILIARRTTLEWALRRSVAQFPSVEVRSATTATALLGGPGPSGPTVRGVVLGGGETVAAAAVIMAGGRRPDLPGWLAPLGVDIPEEVHETGIVYLTRWYRSGRDLASEMDPRLAGDLGFLKYMAVPCDANTVSVTFGLRTRDGELRSALRDPACFDRAARLLPGPDQLFEENALRPIGPVHPMGGLINRLRRFCDAGGAPLVAGFHALGDAHTCTNPLYGRGCSLTLVQAGLLADAFAAHPGDTIMRARDYEAQTRVEIEPWYHLSVLMDGTRTDHEGDRSPVSAPGFAAPWRALMVAGARDPVIGRGIYRVFNLLVTPDQLFGDPQFVSAVAAVLSGPRDDADAPPGPTRDELLDAVAA
jgi:2-polyprenyl-6-methoxyphenol hydroxylase-like FAD-dependent oxidoreductase